MIMIEVPIAIISVCLPGSIYLIKQSIHKSQFYWSEISSRINSLKPLSSSETLNLRHLSTLKRDKSEDFTRLTDNKICVEPSSSPPSEVYNATAYGSLDRCGKKMGMVTNEGQFTFDDAELGFPLREIHVQHEIDIRSSTLHE